MVHIEIEKVTIPFDKQLLFRWKERDPEVVPEFAMNWSGNGVKNGYGFGEWLSEAYFRRLGFYVINDEYDLFSKTSKYKRYNDIISDVVGKERMKEFQGVMREWYANGYRTENLDLFVFNTNSCFFAESKKGNDFLREEQIRFMYLAKQLLHTESKLVI